MAIGKITTDKTHRAVTRRKSRPSAILDFWKFNFLTVGAVGRPILPRCSKFRKDRSNCRGDFAVSVISKIAAAAILDFWNSNFFHRRSSYETYLASPYKFRKDRPNRCGDVAIFVIFQDGGLRYLGFLKIRNFNRRFAVRGQSASSCQILSKSVKQLHRYDDLTFFSKMAAVRHLRFVGRYWDHPRWPLGGLYRCEKFGWNPCCSFDNMKLSIFCTFSLKTPIHAPKNCFLGVSPPKRGAIWTKPPKGTSLCECASFEPQAWKSFDGSDL